MRPLIEKKIGVVSNLPGCRSDRIYDDRTSFLKNSHALSNFLQQLWGIRNTLFFCFLRCTFHSFLLTMFLFSITSLSFFIFLVALHSFFVACRTFPLSHTESMNWNCLVNGRQEIFPLHGKPRLIVEEGWKGYAVDPRQREWIFIFSPTINLNLHSTQ